MEYQRNIRHPRINYLPIFYISDYTICLYLYIYSKGRQHFVYDIGWNNPKPDADITETRASNIHFGANAMQKMLHLFYPKRLVL